MKKANVYFFALLVFDDEKRNATVHAGLATSTSGDYIRKDLAATFKNLRHVFVAKVPELEPVYDGDGEVVGYKNRDKRPANPGKPLFVLDESYQQTGGQPVENMEGVEHVPQT